MSITAFLISMVVYFALGFMGAMAFDNVQRLISMNWSNYTGMIRMRPPYWNERVRNGRSLPKPVTALLMTTAFHFSPS